jgi:hypothetical protein
MIPVIRIIWINVKQATMDNHIENDKFKIYSKEKDLNTTAVLAHNQLEEMPNYMGRIKFQTFM